MPEWIIIGLVSSYMLCGAYFLGIGLNAAKESKKFEKLDLWVARMLGVVFLTFSTVYIMEYNKVIFDIPVQKTEFRTGTTQVILDTLNLGDSQLIYVKEFK